MLFVTDSHLRKIKLAPCQMGEDAGTLYLAQARWNSTKPSAARADDSSLEAPDPENSRKAGRAQFEMPRLKNLKAA